MQRESHALRSATGLRSGTAPDILHATRVGMMTRHMIGGGHGYEANLEQSNVKATQIRRVRSTILKRGLQLVLEK